MLLLRLLLRHVAQFYRKMILCLSLSRAIPTSVGADGSPFHMITIVLVQVCLPFADFVTRLRHADTYLCVFSLLFRWGWSRKFGRRGCCSLISPRHSSKKLYCQNIARTKQQASVMPCMLRARRSTSQKEAADTSAVTSGNMSI